MVLLYLELDHAWGRQGREARGLEGLEWDSHSVFDLILKGGNNLDCFVELSNGI